MNDEHGSLDPTQAAWLNQDVAPLEMSIDEIRRKSDALDRQLRNRSLREWIASAVVIVLFVFLGARDEDPLYRLGCALVCAGAVLISLILWKWGKAPPPADPAFDTVTYLRVYRAELAHQVRLLRWVPLWYLGPFFPGIVLILIRRGVDTQATNPSLVPMIGTTVFLLAVFGGVWAINIWAGRKLERELRALPDD